MTSETALTHHIGAKPKNYVGGLAGSLERQPAERLDVLFLTLSQCLQTAWVWVYNSGLGRKYC
jgi:hypothetical protein